MSDNEVIQAIRRMAGTHNVAFAKMVPCTVSVVDIDSRSCTCTPLKGKTSSDLTGVQLMAEVDDGWLLEPVIDSTVIVGFSDTDIPYVAMFSELANATLIVAGKIQLQGGEFGGLVKVIDLTEKLNAVEQDLNTLKAAFEAWTPVPNDGGSALKIASATWAGENITVTVREDIENDSIVQGA